MTGVPGTPGGSGPPAAGSRKIPRNGLLAAALLVTAAVGIVLIASARISSSPPSGSERVEGGSGPEPAHPGQGARQITDTLTITTYDAVAAQAATDTVSVFDHPDSSEPFLRLPRKNEHGAPQTFLVREFRKGWVKAMLPTPPNGSAGWIRTSEVEFFGIDFVLRVRLASKRLEVWEAGRLRASYPVGIGKKDTPTPGGTYYIKELLGPLDPSGPWGSYAYGLNGYSNDVYAPDGSPGVIGIHGTNEPESVGKEVSAGCIRLRNEDIERLVPLLPLGTPVEIIND